MRRARFELASSAFPYLGWEADQLTTYIVLAIAILRDYFDVLLQRHEQVNSQSICLFCLSLSF